MTHKVALAHGEDEVEVLEGPELGLLDEEEDEGEGEEVEGGEEAEGADVVEAGVYAGKA